MLGENLKTLRLSKNLTQQKVADSLGIRRDNYTHYELNKRQPNYDMLVKIADFFNVSADYLLARTEQPKETNPKLGSLEWLRQGLIKSGYTNLSDKDVEIILGNISALAESLNKRAKDNTNKKTD